MQKGLKMERKMNFLQGQITSSRAESGVSSEQLNIWAVRNVNRRNRMQTKWLPSCFALSASSRETQQGYSEFRLKHAYWGFREVPVFS